LTLQIEQQETENRELKLTVQVDEARVQDEMRKTARKIAKQMRIPGFRPGKAPYHVVQNWVGLEALRAESVDAITQQIYKEVLDQVEAVPFAPGSLDEMEMEPLVMHFTIPLQPEVELGDYREVRVEAPVVEVSDEEVNEAMEAIQEKHALLEPADRPAQGGDVVIADFKAVQDGAELINREGAEVWLDPKKLYPHIPFVENVVGMSAGEEKSFEVDTSGDDDEEEEGEEQKPRLMTYNVKVHEVKSRYLPPLTDDLAREEGDFESLLDLRVDVRKKLTDAAQQKADGEYVDQVFDKIREGATITYPLAAVENEIDLMIEDIEQRFSQQGWGLDDFLKIQGKNREGLREEYRPEAVNRLERSQLTIALVEAERLSFDDGEIDHLVDERLGQMGDMEEETLQQIREMYTSGQGRMMMANDMMMTKFTERLKAIGLGEAPELPEPSDEEE